MPSDYKIPEEMLSKIPDGFYIRFIFELESAFGEKIFDQVGLSCLVGTFGWRGALKTSCEAFDMMWLDNYYKNLRWYEADRFDDEFLAILKEKHGIERSEKPLSEAKP